MSTHLTEEAFFRGMVINSSYERKENSVFRSDCMHLNMVLPKYGVMK